jgi:hypothetical protein
MKKFTLLFGSGRAVYESPKNHVNAKIGFP